MHPFKCVTSHSPSLFFICGWYGTSKVSRNNTTNGTTKLISTYVYWGVLEWVSVRTSKTSKSVLKKLVKERYKEKKNRSLVIVSVLCTYKNSLNSAMTEWKTKLLIEKGDENN